MSRIFITGSADGLGQMAARLLVAQGIRWCCMPAMPSARIKRCKP